MPSPKSTLPPGPSSPPLWQLLAYAHDPLGFFERCARRFSTPFTVRWMKYGTAVMFTDADSIRDVFRGDPHALHSGEANSFLSLSVGSTSVLVLDEEAHARQRRVLLPPMKGERMRAFFDAMRAATRDEARAWERGRPVQMLPAMRRITLRVILQAVLGLPLGPELTDLEHKVERVLAAGRMSHYSIVVLPFVPSRLVANSRWVPFFRQLRQLDEALHAFIARSRKQPAEGDSVFADLAAATHEDGRPLTDAEIRDAVVTMLMAGHDTTSIALAWALEQIVPRPDVVNRITDELKQVTGGELYAEHLDRLTYLDAAIRESMRVRTIIPFVVRLTKQPFTAGGREYPPGVMLSPCSHLVHRRPDLYPEPEVFRPERFLERKFGPHEWFPFGGGNRVCLGMAFALYEMKVVLAELFNSVRQRGESHSRPVRQGLSLGPHDGVPLVVEAG
ncbi:MAG: cytochrome P450 [Gemmataceae bacterium]